MGHPVGLPFWVLFGGGGLDLGDEFCEEVCLGALAGGDGTGSAGEDDLAVGHADEAENLLEIGGLGVVALGGGAGGVEAAGGDDDGELLALDLAFISAGDGDADADDVVDPGLEDGRDGQKLYMGVAMRTWSAAMSSAMRLLEMAMALATSGEWDSAGV